MNSWLEMVTKRRFTCISLKSGLHFLASAWLELIRLDSRKHHEFFRNFTCIYWMRQIRLSFSNSPNSEQPYWHPSASSCSSFQSWLCKHMNLFVIRFRNQKIEIQSRPLTSNRNKYACLNYVCKSTWLKWIFCSQIMSAQSNEPRESIDWTFRWIVLQL